MFRIFNKVLGCVGFFSFVFGAAAMDSEKIAIPLLFIAVGVIAIGIFAFAEDMFWNYEEY